MTIDGEGWHISPRFNKVQKFDNLLTIGLAFLTILGYSRDCYALVPGTED